MASTRERVALLILLGIAALAALVHPPTSRLDNRKAPPMNTASFFPREIDTSTLGPIRIDTAELSRKEQRASDLLDRHSPDDLVAASKSERRRWTLEAMIAFANEEVRRDREQRRAS